MTVDGQAAQQAVSAQTAITPVPEKRPMATLASPVGGAMIPERQIEWLTTMAETWDTMPDEIKDALILMQRSFPAGQGGVYYLTAPQSLMVVRYCKAKGLDVHADHWWFDPRNYRVGSTTSGLREEARHRGIDLGPPSNELLARAWPAGKPHFKGRDPNEQDFGYRCKMRVGKGQDFSTYEAWFSTSAQVDKDGALKAGPWRDNPDHMTQVRAQSNCIKNALGSGISQMPEDTDEAPKGGE